MSEPFAPSFSVSLFFQASRVGVSSKVTPESPKLTGITVSVLAGILIPDFFDPEFDLSVQFLFDRLKGGSGSNRFRFEES